MCQNVYLCVLSLLLNGCVLKQFINKVFYHHRCQLKSVEQWKSLSTEYGELWVNVCCTLILRGRYHLVSARADQRLHLYVFFCCCFCSCLCLRVCVCVSQRFKNRIILIDSRLLHIKGHFFLFILDIVCFAAFSFCLKIYTENQRILVDFRLVFS